MSYTKVNWENIPSKGTPMSAENLNHMDDGLADVDYNLAIARSDLTALEGRVDEIAKAPEGSTTGDLELIDGRTDPYGDSYTNIGTAIRMQLSKATNNFAAPYVTASTYQKGDYATYKGTLYKCKDYDVTGTWDVTKWEFTDLTSALESKAEQDGSYENLTSGNAMQLDSYTYSEDQEPYLFRQTGGSVEAGNREEDTIIGATVCWNQFVQNGNFSSGTANWSAYDNSYSTISASGNKLTQSIKAVSAQTSTFPFGVQQPYVIKDATHKYFCRMRVKPSFETNFKVELGGGLSHTTPTISANTEAEIVFISTASIYSKSILVYPHSGVYNVATTGNETIEFSSVNLIDLTQMFGSTIADRAYALEQATAGSGIAWLKSMGFFTKDYYAYDAGSLQSVKVGSHKTVGFNQWDEEWEIGGINQSDGEPSTNNYRLRPKNHIPVIPGATYYIWCDTSLYSSWISGYWYDANKNFIGTANEPAYFNRTFTVPQNAHYFKFNTSDTWGGKTYTGGICINISDPERNGTYEPYVQHTYPLDTTKEWRGILKLDANNKVYADGDIYPPSGEATRKYGIVDLGTLAWGKGTYFVCDMPNDSYSLYSWNSNLIETTKCALYSPKNPSVGWDGIENMQYGIAGKELRINNQSYSDSATFKTAMSGVYFVYLLATPTSESALPYTTPQICAADGTEEYTDYAVAAGTRDVAIPVGHKTKYPPDQVKKLDGLPSDLSFIGPIENGTTASQAYSQGQYFVKNNQFCKALTAIASGATFTLNTNYEVTTVAAELFAALS